MEGVKLTDFINFEKIKESVNFQDPLVFLVFAHVLFNPLMWNIVARAEYRTQFLSRVFRGNRNAACTVNGIVIFVIGLTRDYIYNQMSEAQPKFTPIEDYLSAAYGYNRDTVKLVIDICGYVLLAIGVTLVLGAYIRLGLRGTYLGDYFGFLLEEKVTGFPFNVSSCPMYDGSSINFLAFAIRNRSIMGFLVAIFVFTCYRVACIFEDSFTEMIYSNAEKNKDKEE